MNHTSLFEKNTIPDKEIDVQFEYNGIDYSTFRRKRGVLCPFRSRYFSCKTCGQKLEHCPLSFLG